MEASEKLSNILILNKEDIIEILHNLVHYYSNIARSKNYEDDTFFSTISSELNKFIEEVEEAEFPPLLPPWAYYIDLRIDSFTVGIGKLEPEDMFGIDLQLPFIYDDVLTEASDRSQGRWLHPKSSFLTHTLKTLTVEEYALRNNLSPITIREYIRKGSIMGASKIGRLWYIPLLAKKRTNDQFYSDIGYDYVSTPKNLPLKYKYLDNENIKSLKITKYKKVKTLKGILEQYYIYITKMILRALKFNYQLWKPKNWNYSCNLLLLSNTTPKNTVCMYGINCAQKKLKTLLLRIAA